MRGMPSFGLKQLFLCVTLIAIGAALIAFAFGRRYQGVVIDYAGLRIVAFVVGSAFAGAGIAAPFKRAGMGAAIGPIVATIGAYLLLFHRR
jgi:hypothetical protein